MHKKSRLREDNWEVAERGSNAARSPLFPAAGGKAGLGLMLVSVPSPWKAPSPQIWRRKAVLQAQLWIKAPKSQALGMSLPDPEATPSPGWQLRIMDDTGGTLWSVICLHCGREPAACGRGQQMDLPTSSSPLQPFTSLRVQGRDHRGIRG